MAHDHHHHGESRSDYFTEQLLTIFVVGALGFVAVQLYLGQMLGVILAKQFHLPVLIGGVVVTESVYTIPGLGRLTVDAVLARDFPVIQAVILLFSLVYVVINLLVDLIYTALDPRIRY